jgi:hypothetical protein
MKFKSELLDFIFEKSVEWKYVVCRGFVIVSNEMTIPQQIEFLLTNSRDEDDVIIAQDSVQPAQRQVVFAQSWTAGIFVSEIVEPWLAGERLKLEACEIDVAFFGGQARHVLSDSGEKCLPLPCLVYSEAWKNQSQLGLNKAYPIIKSKRSYAHIAHAYSVVFARSPEQVRFNCFFYIPEHRGRLANVRVEPKDTKFEVVVGVENPHSLPLRVKISCESELEQPRVLGADAPGGEKTFEIESLPKEVKAELFAQSDLVDRRAWRSHGVGSVQTSADGGPQVTITTQIGLPVRNDVMVGATKMVSAYARFFIMENTLRSVVKETLVKRFSSAWVQKIEPPLLANKSPQEQKRIKEVLQKTPDAILDHVYYRDLKSIIDILWNEFQSIFVDKNRTLMKLTELEGLRNDIAHNRVLSDHDIKRIEVYYMDLLSKT